MAKVDFTKLKAKKENKVEPTQQFNTIIDLSPQINEVEIEIKQEETAINKNKQEETTKNKSNSKKGKSIDINLYGDVIDFIKEKELEDIKQDFCRIKLFETAKQVLQSDTMLNDLILLYKETKKEKGARFGLFFKVNDAEKSLENLDELLKHISNMVEIKSYFIPNRKNLISSLILLGVNYENNN